MKQKAIKDNESNSEEPLLKNVPGFLSFELQFLKNLFTDFSTIQTGAAVAVLMNLDNPTPLREALAGLILAKL